ncbi:hypothetical protein EG346_15955 [Chryseobacterium carnipullorum]|uniref:Bacterial regulatory proteins, luxR family n=1 Tax=Chryseobacterium carnipullorum TaxID=1124835 RepID=A0A376DTF3_CHRCU|nr:hypothetical protein [Chryseobacterium carnipullorum]AZA49580.1 hypothetical protein EG346_15955 [Chryseobacterium carnipullorum]STC94881.1 Bacterial regulatory proteins, luxR family [Chryseobacterium carnipullorum]
MKRTNQFTNPWQEKELKILNNVDLTNNEVAEQLNRSYQAVKIKRLELGIKAKSEIDYWTDQEIVFLSKNRLLSNKEISEKIGRTEQSVSLKRNRLGLSQLSKNYDEFEIEYLIVNYHEKTTKEIAEFLGRSISSIQSKAYELGITKKSEYWSKQEIKLLKTNIKKSNESLSKLLNKSLNQIVYKKAHLKSIENRTKIIDEKIDKNVPFSTKGKLNRYIDVLSVLEVGHSFEFLNTEYHLVIQAKNYLSEKIFRTKPETKTTRRIWRLN